MDKQEELIYQLHGKVFWVFLLLSMPMSSTCIHVSPRDSRRRNLLLSSSENWASARKGEVAIHRWVDVWKLYDDSCSLDVN